MLISTQLKKTIKMSNDFNHCVCHGAEQMSGEFFPQPKPPKRWVNKKYREMVQLKRCFACQKPGPSEAHHVTWAEARGMSKKVSDYLCVPLCPDCHRAVHNPVGAYWREVVASLGREDVMAEVIKNMGEWIRGQK